MRQLALDKLAARVAAGVAIADLLDTTSGDIRGVAEHVIRALAARIRQCNSPENSWYIPNATANPSTVSTHRPANPSTEPFNAIGRFWRCGSKLCPDCLARKARQSRRVLREALSRQVLQRHERFYFTTFTIPNIGLSLTATREIVNRAWQLFRKRRLCVSLIRGGAKTEEFTVTAKGYHYHLHFVWLARWLSYQEVRRSWTECVEIAFSEAKQPFEVATKDGLLIVKVKQVQPQEWLIQEVCKYITKADSWAKVKPTHLQEIALVRKWNRMFEVFGSFRAEDSTASVEESPIVHTRSLKDGPSCSAGMYWRDRIAGLNLADYRMELLEEFERCVKGRTQQLMLKFRVRKIITYAEILASASPDPPAEPYDREQTLRNLGL